MKSILETIKQKKLAAFTLTEVMVVLVIIGILMLIALPNFTSLFEDAHSLEAQMQLEHLANRQKMHYNKHFKFAEDFGAVGFEAPKTVQEGGTAKFAYDIVKSDGVDFIARATAVVDFDNDGIFSVWEIDKAGNPTQVIPD
jgi:type IV pilus assembly protein PilE